MPPLHERDARAYIETSPILPQALFCCWSVRTPRPYPIASNHDPIRLYAFDSGVAAVLTVAYFLLRRKPKTAEDLERERREWLDRIGRITDGTVIDVQEMPGTSDRPSTFSFISTTSPASPTKPRRT